jgi:hypothetical protein
VNWKEQRKELPFFHLKSTIQQSPPFVLVVKWTKIWLVVWLLPIFLQLMIEPSRAYLTQLVEALENRQLVSVTALELPIFQQMLVSTLNPCNATIICYNKNTLQQNSFIHN